MPHVAATAQPRLARARDEFRGLGLVALGIAVCTLAWWLMGLALGEDVRLLGTGVAALVGMVVVFATVGPLSRRRVRGAVRHTTPPIGSLYETPAAAGQRRARLAMVIVAGPLLVLAFYRMAREGGEAAGFLAGAFAAYAVLALGEAGIWARRERRESTWLYVLVRADAMMAPLTTTDVYERTLPEPDDVSPFDLPK